MATASASHCTNMFPPSKGCSCTWRAGRDCLAFSEASIVDPLIRRLANLHAYAYGASAKNPRKLSAAFQEIRAQGWTGLIGSLSHVVHAPMCNRADGARSKKRTGFRQLTEICG